MWGAGIFVGFPRMNRSNVDKQGETIGHGTEIRTKIPVRKHLVEIRKCGGLREQPPFVLDMEREEWRALTHPVKKPIGKVSH